MTQKPITDEQLILYAVGDLADPEATATESYLAGSPQATAYVAKVRCVLETMRTDDTEAPSIAMIKRTVTAFSGAEGTDEQSGPLAWLEELGHRVARLIFDSRAQAALAGFRGTTWPYMLAPPRMAWAAPSMISRQRSGASLPWSSGKCTGRPEASAIRRSMLNSPE